MRRRFAVLSAVLSASVAGLALVTGVGRVAAATTATAAPATTLVWGTAEAVPGLAALNHGRQAEVISVSCASAGNCAAGGFYNTGKTLAAFVVSQVNGRWGTAEAVPGLAALGIRTASQIQTVSCASAGQCSAGGFGTADSGRQAFVVSEVGGRWRAAEAVPGLAALNTGGNAEVQSVSCTAAGRCSAGGYYSPRGAGVGNRAFVANETGGVWGPAEEIADAPNSEITSVSCASNGNCAAVGGYYPSTASASQQAFTVDETGGAWGALQPVAGTTAQLNSVSCASAGNCSAGGYSYDALSHVDDSIVVNETAGHWGTAQPVPGLAALGDDDGSDVYSVSCATAGNCVAGGYYGIVAATARAFVADETDGTWATVTPLPSDGSISSVSCGAAGNCSAGGFSGEWGDTEGTLLVDQAKGVWGSVLKVAGVDNDSGLAMVNSLSCRPSGQCSAGGFTATGSRVQAFVVSRTLKAVTRVSLSLSAARVRYGDEQAEHVSVTVSSSRPGALSGTVTVTAGSTSACVVTLSKGRGGCHLAARRLKTGTYHLIAHWPGNTAFAPSASAAKTLTVVR